MDAMERPPALVAGPAVVPLAIIVIFVLVLVVLGADPTLALGSFAAIVGAATRLLRG